MKVVLDFETRSTIDLQKCGADAYSKHETTDVLCLVYTINSKAKLIKFKEFDRVPEDWGPLTSTALFTAFNSFFDRCIYENVLVPRYGWPAISADQWRCVSVLAKYNGLPGSLNGACYAAGLEKQKDVGGHKAMLKLCKPTKKGWCEDPEELEKLYKYCVRDVFLTEELEKSLVPLSPFELEVFKLDQKINSYGIPIDFDLVRAGCSKLKDIVVENKKRATDLTKGELENVNSGPQLKAWSKKQGVVLTSYSEGYLLSMSEKIDSNIVKELIEIKISLSKTSTGKYLSLFKSIDLDDFRIRGTLQYYGASATGRWAGRGFQPQNLPRCRKDLGKLCEDIKEKSFPTFKNEYPDFMDSMKVSIRGAIRTSGIGFLGADYSGIETRILMWLCSVSDAIDLIEKGGDLYVDMASSIYKKPKDSISKEERALGKTAILGLGYQMWEKEFHQSCLRAGLDVSPAFCSEVVETYRKKYRKVESFWEKLNKHAALTIKNGRRYRIGKILIYCESSVLNIVLPSGRVLRYRDPQVSFFKGRKRITYEGVHEKTGALTRIKIYGGKICENICQAIARDILAFALLNIDKAGYNIFLHVHDEVLCEKAEGQSLQEMMDIMTQRPPWAFDLPLAVEGWEDDIYSK